MKKIKIESQLIVYHDLAELDLEDQKLMKAAFEARDRAYAPYSGFSVGAALLLDNGEVVTGNNQENACYPSGLCAERTAIFYAGARYPNVKFRSMAISAKAKNRITSAPIPPCGACRQSIAEYEVNQKTPIRIFFMGETGQVMMSHSLANLLPLLFTQEYL